ncbi:peptidoglycan editing factor PgeF [Bacillus sp. FJAT-45037]|uniref:peptidoglycan editing factor PgeF n=1 Tax=Bacillus sp. FJAT-45037 TaxID=2011007 RepID=UPI000C2393FB|nr:peptidoglycan editing factor PgeF [Bacillus sp. FJAT-45037]
MGEPFIQQDDTHLSVDRWQTEHPTLLAGISTRDGGVSQPPFSSLNMGFHVQDNEQDVRENRVRLARKLRMPLERWVSSEQIHEATIQKISHQEKGLGATTLETAIKGTDGLYTRENGILLTSLYADCVPLLFFAPKHQAVGLAHAGWKGTVASIGPKMIDAWVNDEQIPIEDIKVAIGPCISGEAYEVDERPVEAVCKICPLAEEKNIFYPNNQGRYQLDLRKLNQELLINQGVKKENILISTICTASDERMYSYRAESGLTGRMMSYIGLK